MSELIWQEVECGGYTADLPLWEELADRAEPPVMELGCGVGRVTLHLARHGVPLVIGLDRDPELVAALWERSKGTTGDAELGDARGFELATQFGLVLAPMQLIQLLGDGDHRSACLASVARSVVGGGHAAFAIVEGVPIAPAEGAPPPLPDVRQVEGWIYSSLPLPSSTRGDTIVLRRLRQTVDPGGEMSDEVNEVEIAVLSAEALEAEGEAVGLKPAGRREIPATEAHVGSTVVIFEKEA